MSHFKMTRFYPEGFFGESLYYEYSIYIWTDKPKILNLFICLRSTGFLCAFLRQFFPAVKTLGSTAEETSYTHLYPQPYIEQHMQRFGSENPHDIIYMLFLLPQEASDCVNSSLQCFTPSALTWLQRHLCQTPSGG